MIDYNLFFQQNTIHDRWHTRLNNNIIQVQYYHRDLSCPYCYPPGPNTPQFVNFWDWYSTENPTGSYTSNTQQALEDLSDAPTIRDLWEAIYSLVFTVRYTDIPRPYTNLRQEIYNACILTDNFEKDFYGELLEVTSETEELELSEVLTDSSESLVVQLSTGSSNYSDLEINFDLIGPEPGLLYINEDLYLNNLFKEEEAGLLYTDEDLHLDFLFQAPDPGLLYTDEELYLENLFNEPEEPDMVAMAGGMPNANQLLNALNNLTNALGVGGNNMQNVNNALNNLNAAVTANNNAMLNWEVQAAPVPTFYGGNQDPITWLNEFNNACAANGWNAARKLQVVPAYLKGTAAVWWQTVVNNTINAWGGAANNNTFEHVFKQQFRTPALVEMWSTELDQRQQQPSETVDQYASAIRELYQRINTPVFAYPDNVQARKFVSGLLPELYMAVKPFGDQTLTDAINRAKACELTMNSGRPRIMNYAQTGKSEMAELTKLVTVLAQQVSEIEKKIDNRPSGSYRKPPAARPELSVPDRPPIVCYSCGEPGHISRRCPKKENTTGGGAPLEGEGAKPVQNPSYVTLFQAYPAQRNRPKTRSTPYPNKEIIEEENAREDPQYAPIPIPIQMTNNVGEGELMTVDAKEQATEIKKKKATVRKKKTPKVQPSIAAHIPPYNIVADLQQQRANITFGQLFQISPKL
ncbi:hypothetical protein GLOIN_2v1869520 [Rhizophagus irregularis DAOM 181602=DAOM 197198]|nr:hypothetical protein GLOIN_2v1869520 [Rhizophagus irregularis DAOM 181602=DAOM 197198]